MKERGKNGARTVMSITIENMNAVLAIGAGIAILILPQLLNYIVAIYLIIVGLLGLGIISG